MNFPCNSRKNNLRLTHKDKKYIKGHILIIKKLIKTNNQSLNLINLILIQKQVYLSGKQHKLKFIQSLLLLFSPLFMRKVLIEVILTNMNGTLLLL
jgi:hypothetical protein